PVISKRRAARWGNAYSSYATYSAYSAYGSGNRVSDLATVRPSASVEKRRRHCMKSLPNDTAPATVPIRSRIDRAELEQARTRAAKAGMSLAEFVRSAVRAFNPPPKGSYPAEVLATVQELNAIS